MGMNMVIDFSLSTYCMNSTNVWM